MNEYVKTNVDRHILDTIIKMLDRIVKAREKFLDEFKSSPTSALQWNAEEIMNDEKQEYYYNQLLDGYKDGQSWEGVIAKQKESIQSMLLNQEPWRVNSTNPISNLSNLAEATAMSRQLTFLHRIEGELGNYTRMYTREYLKENDSLVIEVKELSNDWFKEKTGKRKPEKLDTIRNAFINWVVNEGETNNGNPEEMWINKNQAWSDFVGTTSYNNAVA